MHRFPYPFPTGGCNSYADRTMGDKFEYMIISAEDYSREIASPGSIDMSSVKWQKYTSGSSITI